VASTHNGAMGPLARMANAMPTQKTSGSRQLAELSTIRSKANMTASVGRKRTTSDVHALA